MPTAGDDSGVTSAGVKANSPDSQVIASQVPPLPDIIGRESGPDFNALAGVDMSEKGMSGWEDTE